MLFMGSIRKYLDELNIEIPGDAISNGYNDYWSQE